MDYFSVLLISTVVVTAALVESMRQQHLVTAIPLTILVTYLAYLVVFKKKQISTSVEPGLPELERISPTPELEFDGVALLDDQVIIFEQPLETNFIEKKEQEEKEVTAIE